MSRYRDHGDPDNFPTFLAIAIVLLLLFTMFGCMRRGPDQNSCKSSVNRNFTPGSVCRGLDYDWDSVECISGGAIYQCMCVEVEGRTGPPVVSCAATNRLPSTRAEVSP